MRVAGRLSHRRGAHHQGIPSAYRNGLDLAVKHGIKTIAFPAISCGIYRYPIAAAAQIAVDTVAAFLAGDQTIEQVVFACFGADVLVAFQTALG